MYLLLKMKNKTKKHPWDETLLIAVLVVASISILILLAGYINTTGKAASLIPTKSGTLNMLNKCETFSGEAGGNQGKYSRGTNCRIVCGDVGKISFLSGAGDSFDLSSNTKIIGNKFKKEKYNCLCCSP